MEAKKLTYIEFIDKIYDKIDKLAEARGMNRQQFMEWSKEETFRTEINNSEHLLLLAYQTEQAILRLEADLNEEGLTVIQKTKLQTTVDSMYAENGWIESWKKDFEKVPQVMKHLTDVCAYCKEAFNRTYPDEWLLTWDDQLYNKLRLDRKKGSDKLKWKKKKDPF